MLLKIKIESDFLSYENDVEANTLRNDLIERDNEIRNLVNQNQILINENTNLKNENNNLKNEMENLKNEIKFKEDSENLQDEFKLKLKKIRKNLKKEKALSMKSDSKDPTDVLIDEIEAEKKVLTDKFYKAIEELGITQFELIRKSKKRFFKKIQDLVEEFIEILEINEKLNQKGECGCNIFYKEMNLNNIHFYF